MVDRACFRVRRCGLQEQAKRFLAEARESRIKATSSREALEAKLRHLNQVCVRLRTTAFRSVPTHACNWQMETLVHKAKGEIEAASP